MVKKGIFAILLFVFSALVSALVYLKVPKNEIVISDQPAGTTLFIKRLTLWKGGYIVLRPFTLYDGYLESSTSDYMPAGIYTDFNVEIVGTTPRLIPGTFVFVELREENGDALFDPDLDKPVRKWYGKELSEKITLL